MIQLINGSTKTIDGTLKTIYKSSPSYQTNGLGCETYVFWSGNCPKQSPCTPNWCDGCDICTGRTEVVECFPNPTFLHIDSRSSTGGGPSDGQNPSSNSPSNDENAIATSPVINIPSLDEPEKNPCGELTKFNTNNSIQQTLRILKGQSSGSAERGNYISETTNSVGATYLSFPVIPQNPQNPNLLNINAGLSTGKVKGAMHCHINPSLGMIPMFSWADLDALYQISYYHVPSNNAEKDYAEYTVMLSVGSGHYALKFKNFDGQYDTFNNNINQFKEELEKECRAITSMATAEQQQKTF